MHIHRIFAWLHVDMYFCRHQCRHILLYNIDVLTFEWIKSVTCANISFSTALKCDGLYTFLQRSNIENAIIEISWWIIIFWGPVNIRSIFNNSWIYPWHNTTILQRKIRRDKRFKKILNLNQLLYAYEFFENYFNIFRSSIMFLHISIMYK